MIERYNDRAHSLMIWICLGIFIPIAIIIAVMPPDSDMMAAFIVAFLGGAAILLSNFLVDDITDYLFNLSSNGRGVRLQPPSEAPAREDGNMARGDL